MSRILRSVKTDDVVRVSAKNSGKRNIYIPAKNRVCAGSRCLDVRTVCSKFSLRVAKKEPKSVALGSIPTKGAKNSCLPFYKASYFPIYLRFAIRTRFFSPPTDSIFVRLLQPPPGSPQVVPGSRAKFKKSRTRVSPSRRTKPQHQRAPQHATRV